MAENKENKLKQKIIEEMMIDYSNALEKNFDIAKQLIKITNSGKVDILFKDKLTGQEQIILYLIGKLYAKEAGFTTSSDVSNEELLEELSIPRGSLLPWIKGLRDQNKIKTIMKERFAYHGIPINLIERMLKEIQSKIKKKI